jgi:NAD(P)-dependent dehydrogenase (short-subunit alcohol dehydrogenase family)
LVRAAQLDTTDAESVSRFASWLQETYGGVDILINNAGIAFKVRITNGCGRRARTDWPDSELFFFSGAG